MATLCRLPARIHPRHRRSFPRRMIGRCLLRQSLAAQLGGRSAHCEGPDVQPHQAYRDRRRGVCPENLSQRILHAAAAIGTGDTADGASHCEFPRRTVSRFWCRVASTRLPALGRVIAGRRRAARHRLRNARCIERASARQRTTLRGRGIATLPAAGVLVSGSKSSRKPRRRQGRV